jgi:glycerol-3-phosphate dehydrogenase [NAD(P)+]
MDKICVIGAGSWGTAVACTLSKNGHETVLFMRRKEQYDDIKRTGKNLRYFPELELPSTLQFSNDLKTALEGVNIVILAVSSQGNLNVIKELREWLPSDVIVVNISKGLDREQGLSCSQMMAEYLPNNPFAVLTGPSHAEEVMIQMPTALVCASKNLEVAKHIQELVSNDTMRVYVIEDVIGAELGGALKNIIAFGIGIVDGLGYGDNTKAAIMTRGIAEMTRFGVSMGAKVETFSGLAGIGDLIVTCTSMHSRNRRAGILVGKGMSLEQVQSEINMVVEGIVATRVIGEMSKKMGIDMPITHAIYHVLFENGAVQDAVVQLMGREKKHEVEAYHL